MLTPTELHRLILVGLFTLLIVMTLLEATAAKVESDGLVDIIIINRINPLSMISL